MSLVAIAVVVMLAIGLAGLIGVRVGRRICSRVSESERTQMYGLQASLLGLLALLLGFSFAMGETRLDLRKQFALDEANAVGTAWLRTTAVTDPRARDIRRILERYVAIRLGGYAASPVVLRAALEESERLQRDAWSRAAALAHDNPQSLPVSLLVEALNRVIDAHASRVAAGRNHIPTAVLATLVAVAVAAIGWFGVCVGVSTRRGMLLTVALALLIASVVVVIVDLDQARAGFVRVDQATLADLQRSFR